MTTVAIKWEQLLKTETILLNIQKDPRNDLSINGTNEEKGWKEPIPPPPPRPLRPTDRIAEEFLEESCRISAGGGVVLDTLFHVRRLFISRSMLNSFWILFGCDYCPVNGAYSNSNISNNLASLFIFIFMNLLHRYN